MVRTYISLFSCAGVGCYGFKMNNFECIASNELLESRIAVQRANHKCLHESGYICGDATSPETHQRIVDEIQMWRDEHNLQQVDVVFATPPCQGMSTANYKKTDHEQIRNSLVVEAIRMIMAIHPKVFVFENVRAFMKSICTDISGKDVTIKDCIFNNLSEQYNIYWKVINFKDYGVPSSRPRTLVIGTSRELHHVMPLDLFPTRKNEILLRDSIGGFNRLAFGEKDEHDPFHFARPFPEYMLDWIKDLKEGETAFDNPDNTKPCTFDKDGNRVINKGAYMGNKYRRLIWDRPGACIATRSDVMSSQDTIHPCDNRVLSIRELMTLMTIPNTFQWTGHDAELTVENSDEYLKENEGNIRRCIGEAVPTHIGYTIASKIKRMLDYEDSMNNVNVENPEGNFYIASNDLKGFAMEPQMVFDDLMQKSTDFETVSVEVESMSSFVVYMPMFASCFSHVDRIKVDLISRAPEDVDRLHHLLTLIDLGDNVNVNIINEPTGNYYNFKIKYDGCHESPKLVKKASKRKDDDNQLQLSFF